MSHRLGSFIGRQQSAKRRGFGLIDVILAVGASAVIYAGMAQMQNDQRMSASAVTTAHQLAMVSEAAKAYVKKNYSKLTTLVPINSVVEIPLIGSQNWGGVGDVQYGGGLLSFSFNPTLPNGQTIHFLARHVSSYGNIPDHLESMLVTTGVPMSDRQVGIAMNVMEGSGGGVMTRPPMGIPANVIQGSFGSWSQPIGTWSASGVPITSGHIAYAMDNIGSPLSDYLNRYNTGNPEANRLHTHIDFNGNNADNMNNLDVQTINDTRADSIKVNTAFDGNTNLRNTNAGNSVSFKNGVNLCQNNARGCGISISDDGGFYDYNDGWITLTNSFSSMGLHLSDSGNGSGNLWADGYGKFQGNLASRGYDPDGFPTLAMDRNATTDAGRGTYIPVAQQEHETAWTGGLHTKDVFADGGHIGAGYGQKLNTWMTPDGEIEAIRIGAGLRSAAGPYPGSWGGGIHTLDMYAEGAIGGGSNGTMNVAMTGQNHQGYVWASQYLQAPVFRPQYTAWENTSCGNIYPSRPQWGGHWQKAQIDAYAFQAAKGDIAQDNNGNVMSCVNGAWKRAGYSKDEIYQMIRQIVGQGSGNNSSQPSPLVSCGLYGCRTFHYDDYGDPVYD